MIFTDRTVIVQKGTSSINDTIVLYRGDKNVEIRFTLNEGSPFKFGSGASPNIIEKTEASYGQLVINTPNDLPSIFSEIVPTSEGKIVFTITAEMIDEITEVGHYTFQIRLFDENKGSRAPLPEVNYVTKDTGNANQITFSDGQTFQAKLDNGTLKGDKGDTGEQGPAGQDGLTTAISVNGNTYTHVNGTITLPNYPTSTGDSHTHSNKDVLDSITSTKVSNWDSAIPFNNSVATDANTWLTNGYIKTGVDTANLPSVLSTHEKYGILFFLAENSANGTGTQMFFPMDGSYRGKIFTRSLVAMNTIQQVGEWYMLSTFDGDYNSLNNLPVIPSLDGYASETYVNNKIAEASLSGGEVDLSGYVTKGVGNASQIQFADGETFQAKLEAGVLKGEKGDKGDKGEDGLTTQVRVNGTTYTQVDGVITLPNYPASVGEPSHTHSNKDILDTITADNVHTHSNKSVIDAITSDMTTKWNKSIPFENSYVSDCNAWLTNGYTKTNTDTANHPSVCTGADRWGVLFYISENADNGTGTQMYFPMDGTYAGRIFTRKIIDRNVGDWNLVSTFNGDYDSLTNKPTNISTFTNDAHYASETFVTNKIAEASLGNNPSTGNVITLGNYIIQYNETDDTLDFIYTGSITEDNVITPTWIPNTNIGVSGTVSSDAAAMVTDFIPIESGYTYTINLTSTSSTKISFWDSSKTFISRSDNYGATGTDVEITFPSSGTTAYIRLKTDENSIVTRDNVNQYVILKKVANA